MKHYYNVIIMFARVIIKKKVGSWLHNLGSCCNSYKVRGF